jgi:hypothetical protein
MSDKKPPTSIFDEIAERVARSRLSFATTFVTAKTLVHWKALFILSHADGNPWNAEAALTEATRRIEDIPLCWSWGVPTIAALVVSAGYPFLAGWLRTAAAFANAGTKKRNDSIEGKDLERKLGQLVARTRHMEERLAGFRDGFVRAYATQLSDPSVELFPGSPALGRFYHKASDGRLAQPDLSTAGDAPNIFVPFLNVPGADCVLAARKFIWLPSDPPVLYLFTDGQQNIEGRVGDPSALPPILLQMRPAKQRRGDGQIWEIHGPGHM